MNEFNAPPRKGGKVKPGLLFIIGAVVLALSFVALRQFGVWDTIMAKLSGSGSNKSVTLDKREKLEDIDVSNIPKSQVKAPQRTSDNPEVTIAIWTWQAELPLLDAVGGTGNSGDHPDSPLAQAGITRTKLLVQNDTSEQAKLMSTGNVHFMTTTGDQSAVDINGLNNLLRGTRGKAIYSTGYSYGEDTFMAAESIKNNPQLARGIVVVAAVPYCDWNVTVNWAIDNQIPVNPDENSYDPDAINFVNAVDHIEAAQKYVQNARVSLRNVKTGKTEEHEITGLGTWTPGDVMAVRGRPTVTYRDKTEKLNKVASTKQYNFMMPNVLVVDINWASQHREYVETLLRVLARSAEKIQQDDEYLRTRVAPLAYKVFNVNSMSPNDWYKYFKGTTENGVPLGGSRVNNISEVRHLFGLDQSVALENSVYGLTYTGHGNRLKQLLPDRLPSFAPVSDVVDTSFIRAITDERTSNEQYTSKFEESNAQTTVVSSTKQINFDSGSAVIKPTPENLRILEEIRSLLIRAGNTRVTLEGHTDNSGNPAGNMDLSRRRAQAVWDYLKSHDTTKIITEERLIGIEPYGQFRPVQGTSDSQTPEQMAANRRVVIILR